MIVIFSKWTSVGIYQLQAPLMKAVCMMSKQHLKSATQIIHFVPIILALHNKICIACGKMVELQVKKEGKIAFSLQTSLYIMTFTC